VRRGSGWGRPADEQTNTTLERIGLRHLPTVEDAVIAASGRDEADALVTGDGTLQKRIQREGLKVTLLTFEEFRRHVSTL
jgi:rRNA-processing protein FCF1